MFTAEPGGTCPTAEPGGSCPTDHSESNDHFGSLYFFTLTDLASNRGLGVLLPLGWLL